MSKFVGKEQSSRAATLRRGEVIRRVLEDTLRRRSSGEMLPDEQVVAAHPELAPELQHELALLTIIRRAADSVAGGSRRGSSIPASFPFASSDVPRFLEGYELVREIHRGGQGTVFEAIQKSTRRRVAIKFMSGGPFAGRRDRARFEREVQILAQLNHPNIVTIHDSGVTAECSWFVMDYIDGHSLDEWAESRRRGSTDSTGANGSSGAIAPAVDARDRHLGSIGRAANLDARPNGNGTTIGTAGHSNRNANPKGQAAATAEFVRVFIRICDAVNAAHLRGVVHRDLKPGNIRVDDSGDPHVLDFGLARTMGSADTKTGLELTATGQFVGSLPWSSPEQAAGDSDRIDIRTDVYSLGVMLYQLVVGRFPYEVTGPMRQVVDRITTCEPAPPRAVCPEVDPDLDTIVLKCLQKDPQRRYQNAGELGRDLARYAADEPIEARRDSTLYVLRKTLARYRTVAGVVAALLIGAVAFGVYANHQAAVNRGLAEAERSAREQAQTAEQAALAAQLETVRERDEARRARDAEREQRRNSELQRERAEAVTRFLIDTLGIADPDVTQRPEISVKELLDRSSGEVAGAFADQPEAEARARLIMGRAYAASGELETAREHLARALELRREELESPPEEVYEALAPYAQVLEELGDIDWRTYWWEVWRLYPVLAQRVNPELGTALSAIAPLMGERYTPEGSDPLYQKFHDVAARSLRADDPFWLIVADFLYTGGANAGLKKKPQAACRFLGDALDIRRPFLSETHIAVVRTLGELVRNTIASGDHARAEALARESLALLQRVLPDDHWYAAVYRAQLGTALIGQGRHDDAEKLLLDNLPVIEAARGENSTYARDVAVAVIRLYQASNRNDAAELWRKSLAQRLVSVDQAILWARYLAPVLGPERQELIRAFDQFYSSLDGKAENAAAALEAVLDLRRRLIPEDDIRTEFVADILIWWGTTLANRRGLSDDAPMRLYREVSEITRTAKHLSPWKKAIASAWLAYLLEHRRQFDEALQAAREGLHLLEQKYPDHPVYPPWTRGVIGGCLMARGEYAEAEPLLTRSFQGLLASQGPSSGNAQKALERLARLYALWGRPEAAEPHLRAFAQAGRLSLRDIRPLLEARCPEFMRLYQELDDTPGIQRTRIDQILTKMREWRRQNLRADDIWALAISDVLYRVADSFSRTGTGMAWEPAFEEVHEIEKAHYPGDHRKHCSTTWWLAVLRNRRGAFAEAEEYARRSMALQMSINPASTSGVAGRRFALAVSLVGQGRFEEAKELVAAGWPELIKSGMSSAYSQEALECALRLYAGLGEPARAEEMVAPLVSWALEKEDFRPAHRVAWRIASVPGLTDSLYGLALQAAQRACERQPGDADVLNTLGAALYRAGRLEEALAALLDADAGHGHDHPADSTLLAMCFSRLGRAEEAARMLERVRVEMQDRWLARRHELAALASEAERMIVGDRQAERRVGGGG